MAEESKSGEDTVQYSTFVVAGRLYGIEVVRVQEIVKPMDMTPVPLADDFVRGLINLRGQVATALGLRELFLLQKAENDALMNVVCKIDSQLVSLQVDEIKDVIEVDASSFEETPQTVPNEIKRFLLGVYKVSEDLLSIIDIDLVLEYIHKTEPVAS